MIKYPNFYLLKIECQREFDKSQKGRARKEDYTYISEKGQRMNLSDNFENFLKIAEVCNPTPPTWEKLIFKQIIAG